LPPVGVFCFLEVAIFEVITSGYEGGGNEKPDAAIGYLVCE
jgi:hypothetical protein